MNPAFLFIARILFGGIVVLCWMASPAPGANTWEAGAGFRRARLAPVQPGTLPRFQEMPASTTRVQFTNSLTHAEAWPNQNRMLGSGVAAGDFDGDGRCDLYFCSIRGANVLLRNLGDWRFEDVTASTPLALAGNASTGAVFADVNGDGRLDLIVTSLGNGTKLFVNEGEGKFRETTEASGLSSKTGSLTLAVADVDGDGDIDLFVCNYGTMAILRRGGDYFVKNVNGQPVVQGLYADRLRVVDGNIIEVGEPSALYLNDGKGQFTLVPWTSENFLNEDGQRIAPPPDFSLSAQFHDVNGDGAPDLYICNDFDSPDRFWLNDGRGRFRIAPRLTLRSQSYASMGVDFADIDRDGHVDFFVVDMLSPNRARRLWQKSALVPEPNIPGVFNNQPQISRNTLFHSRGDGTFAEVANYGGVAASDWSWQGTFLDVDLDGFEDLLVANGNLADVQDLDVPEVFAARRGGAQAAFMATPSLFTPNRAWRNRGDLTFEDRGDAWSFNDTNICHGMALADLDNDGDLDVVINRMNAPALLLRNEASGPRVAIRLKGQPPNTAGVGAKMMLRGGAIPMQSQEVISGGKYLSGDDPVRVFAAGPGPMNVAVTWRSGALSHFTNIQSGFLYELHEPAEATPRGTRTNTAPASTWFVDASGELNHSHAEPPFDDSQLQPLLTRKLSQRGPGICVVDLDQDGHDDLVIGTGRGGRVTFHRGNGRGGFTQGAQSEPVPDDVQALAAWPYPGGMGVLLTLANYENTAKNVPLLLLVLERNELVFNTITDPEALLQVRAAGYGLATADFDGDGDLDVFLGGHTVSGRYPEAARSWLFRNDQGGLHLDPINSAVFTNIGLVNSAIWIDLNNDGWPELVIAGEWGAVQVFRNHRGQLTSARIPLSGADSAISSLDQLTGWWTGLAAGDFDGDGRMDLVAGNWGLNGFERASAAQPLRLYYGDFLGRGVIDLLETEYDGANHEPMPARLISDIAPSLPPLRARFPSHRAWAVTPVRQIISGFANVREANARTLASTVFLNRGETFEARILPREAQLAPVASVLADDFDGDGHCDLFLAQNFFAQRPDHPRLDAGRGLILRGDGRGHFNAVSGERSGVAIYGEQRGAAVGDFNGDGQPDVVVAQNGTATRLLRNEHRRLNLRVQLIGPPMNPNGIGSVCQLIENGKAGRALFVPGASGWLSQSGLRLLIPRAEGMTNRQLHVRWPGGRESRVAVPLGTNSITIRFSEATSGK